MKKISSLLIACFLLAGQLFAQRPVPGQIKKGKWMISHELFQMSYEMKTEKLYINDNYTGKVRYSGFNSNLFFQSQNFGGIGAYSITERYYNDNDIEDSKFKRSGFNFLFRPFVGRFISDRFLLGGELNLYFSREKADYIEQNDSEKNTATYTTLGIGPHVRYYFGKLKSKQLFHAGFSGGVNYSASKQESNDNGVPASVYKTRKPAFYANPYIGSSWFAGKHWTFGASVSYRLEKFRYTNETGNISSKQNTTLSELGLQGSVSFTF